MNRLIQFIFILNILINHPAFNEIILVNFRQEALDEHNFKRDLHCTGPMILNASLNTIAQNYAEYLAANDLFEHSSTPDLGENLFQMSSSNAITYLNGSIPTDNWYDEIAYYNYSNPKFRSTTGHFTQVIWKNSVQLGIGIALSSNNRTVWVVAEYFPSGNVQGQFTDNVRPLCPENLGD